jgi:alpha-ketoglutarate-dependent taurine dioxygenase
MRPTMPRNSPADCRILLVDDDVANLDLLEELLAPDRLDREEATSLLNTVFDHAEKPDFVYEHVWQVGDLLLWDNRCSMHARTDFPGGERRLMWRTTLEGEARPR